MFKQKFPIVFLAVLAIGLMFAANLSADNALKIRVTAAAADLRQAGFLSAPLVGSVQKGQVFTVVEKTGDWYMIQLADGTVGFLQSSVVEEIVEGKTPPVPQPVAPTPEETMPVERPAAKIPARAPAAKTKAAKKDTFNMFLARVGNFRASDSRYTNVYSNGRVFGGEIRFGGQWLAGWIEGNYRSATGKLTYTKEETEMSVVAAEAGALVRFKIIKQINPYLGAGCGMYTFNEKSVPMGEVPGTKLGFCFLGGVSFILGNIFVVDARVKYSTCKMKPYVDEINLGGITLGIGLGLRI